MADEAPQSVDFWSELEEAQQTVEQWPDWQQRYDADVHSESPTPIDSLWRPRTEIESINGGEASRQCAD